MHLTYYRILRKIGLELDKGHLHKSTNNTVVNGKRLDAFPLRTRSKVHSSLLPLLSNQGKNNSIEKRRSFQQTNGAETTGHPHGK